MSDIESLNFKNLESNSWSQGLPETRFEKIATLTVLVIGLMSVMFGWPRLSDYSRFAFICFFPGIFPFCYAVIRAHGIYKARKRRVVSVMMVVHCVLLFGVVFLWRAFPGIGFIKNPDLVFAFTAVEIVAMVLLVRLTRPENREA